MPAAIRVCLIAAVSTALFACGGAKIADSKEAAAAAAFESSRGSSSYNSQLRAFPGLEQALTTSGSSTGNCPRGGTASVTFDVGAGTSTSVDLQIRYSSCNYNGRTSMNGTLTVSLTTDYSSGSSFTMDLAMQGRVDFSGEISDFVQMDVVQTVDASKLSETSGTVTIVLNGTITTSSGTYVYNNEQITITAGTIPADANS